jgi:hypothetical protein
LNSDARFAPLAAGIAPSLPAACGRWLDMQDAELFLSLAGIAGVFVGFAALIAVRSGGPSDPLEVAPMRMLVSMAMLTIVAALAPVALGRYDLTDHEVWALSSAPIHRRLEAMYHR